jgi:CHRD domain-containing protein
LTGVIPGRLNLFGRLTILAAALTLTAAPALAKELKFTAHLTGATPSTTTGSRATGEARIRVNTETQTVDVALDVEGLKVENLWTNLLHSPMGAIHLHVYGSKDHGGGADSALMFPLPYGPNYVATPKGFKVEMKAEPYAEGAKLVNSRASFDEFVAALSNGRIVVNIHTNAKTDGEISGDVVPAA